MTIAQLLTEFVETYGKNKWTYSTYTAMVARIQHYVIPMIGDINVEDFDVRSAERFYKDLLDQPSRSYKNRNCSRSVVREIHKLLNEAFNRAVIWEIIPSNKIVNAVYPLEEKNERVIWNEETIRYAIENCEDPLMSLAINMAFSLTLRRFWH